MLKKVITIALIIIIFLGILFVKGGFRKKEDIFLLNYSLMENNQKMKITITVNSTIGYARGLKVKQIDNKAFITFYSTFGIIGNSNLGAKSEYEISIDPYLDEIYFYVGNSIEKGYKKVLEKNADNNWEKVN